MPNARPSIFSAARKALRSVADLFPLGLAPLIILLSAVLAGGYLLFHPVRKTDATIRMWTFARQHYNAYVNAKDSFEAKHRGVKVEFQNVHGDAVTKRLRAAFWAGLDVPDVVEVEITRAGSFFRGPIESVGFIDLTPLLRRDRLLDRIVRTRLSPYTNRGRIFGLPHDVHPVMLAYRRDLFEELGIDPNALATWDDFIREGRRATDLKNGTRYMINLSKSGAGSAEVLLFQRGGGYFDADGKMILDNEVAVETIRWLVPLMVGPGRIAADPGMFGPSFARSVEDGYCLSFICPDWKSYNVQKDIPRMAGKMAMMPLPAVRPGGRRTSTWGGTMLGITKQCADRELAWQLAGHLYMDKEELGQRFRDTNILPPFRDVWSHPAFREQRPYWSNQRIGQMYIALADQVPPQYGSPFLELAKGKLGGVVAKCCVRYQQRGGEGFEDFVRQALGEAAADIRKQMSRNPF